MGDRDLLLILNIVDYLLETTESSEAKDSLMSVVAETLGENAMTSQPVDSVKIENSFSKEESKIEGVVLEEAKEAVVKKVDNEELKALKEEVESLTHKNKALTEQIESQQQMTQMTIEGLMGRIGEVEAENDDLNKHKVTYKKQGDILFEQVGSQLDMMQMTIEFLNEELKELKAEKEQSVKDEAQYKKQGKIMMEQVDAQLSMMQMTIEYLSEKEKEVSEEIHTLKTTSEKSKKQELILVEQISSQMDMFQMTSEYQIEQHKILEEKLAEALSQAEQQKVLEEELEKALSQIEQQKESEEKLEQTLQNHNETDDAYQVLVKNVTDTYFNANNRLKSLFADIIQFPIEREHAHKSFICVIEKFGIIYLAIIKIELGEDIMGLFNLVSNFAFNNIIGTKKYVDPSRIIEEYLAFVGTMPQGDNSIKADDISVGVCLVDNINLEVEFASTGLSIYSAFNNQIEEHMSGLNTNKDSIERRTIRDNQYKIRKLGFRKGGTLYLSSLEAQQKYLNVEKQEVGLSNVLQEVNGKSADESNQYFSEFISGYSTEDGEPIKNDFLIVGIKF